MREEAWLWTGLNKSLGTTRNTKKSPSGFIRVVAYSPNLC